MKYLENKPLIRKCSWCNEWMDEESKLIAETRDKTEYLISHGICDDCAERIEKELDEWKDIII